MSIVLTLFQIIVNAQLTSFVLVLPSKKESVVRGAVTLDRGAIIIFK